MKIKCVNCSRSKHRTEEEKKDLKRRLIPVIEKGIILDKGCTKGFISRGQQNINLGLNMNNVSIKKEKVKHISLNRFL